MKRNSLSLLFPCAVMDLCWFYAWATFVTLAVLHRPFPFPEAVGAFALACLLTHLSTGRGWRIIWMVCLQALFFIPLLFRVYQVFYSWTPAYAAQTWIVNSTFSVSAARDWFMFLLLSVWIFAFWGGGIRLALRPLDYETVCIHFDRGLVAFFFLLLMKFLLLPQLNIQVEGFGVEYLFFSFFLFSLLAIGVTRNRATTAPRDYLPGYRGLGVILAFTIVVILACSGIIFFFLPYLTRAAETGYVVMVDAARPAGPILLAILRFIFGGFDEGEMNEKAKKAATLPKHRTASSHGWWWDLLGKIVAWLAGIILVLVILAMIAAVVYLLAQWLLSYDEADPSASPPPFSRWLVRLRSVLRAWGQKIFRLSLTSPGIIWLYGALQRWGRRSGLPRIPSETAAEYGLRLQNFFPLLREEITSITETYNREVYGGILPESRCAAARLAWSRLRRPRHWPRRLKFWFFRPEPQRPFPAAERGEPVKKRQSKPRHWAKNKDAPLDT